MPDIFCQTPVGVVCITEEEGAIIRLAFVDKAVSPSVDAGTPLLAEAARQLEAYFAGALREFSLPFRPAGTAFQREVWFALAEIPYGETRSYAEIARAIGRDKACRAVGQANHNNPLPIFLPCHRVIGTNGKLTGYAGGLERKKILLDLEQNSANS